LAPVTSILEELKALEFGQLHEKNEELK